jgi:hypothetical protein
MKNAIVGLVIVAIIVIGAYAGVRTLQTRRDAASAPAPSSRTLAPASSSAAASTPAAHPEAATAASAALPSASATLPSIGESAGPLSTPDTPVAPASAPTAAASTGPPLITPGPPATTTAIDLAADAAGGEVEQMTSVFGPGYLGRRLIDGKPAPTWKLDAPMTYPQEAVFSFFDRERALVSAVTIALPPDASLAPKDVEVWASAESPDAGFVRMATQTFEAQAGEHTIAFPAANARFVKLRILSGNSPKGLEIGEVRVLEAARHGYVPLFQRRPDATTWDGSPRQAGQHGLDWMQQAAPDWQKVHQCFGCHVQAQAVMGQAIALKQDYRVNLPSVRALMDGTHQYQETDGLTPGEKRMGQANNSWFGGSTSATMYGVMTLAYGDTINATQRDPDILKGLDFLIAQQQADGAYPIDRVLRPVIQGNFITTANTL